MTRIPLSFLLFLCCISMLKAQEYDNGIKHFRDGNYTEAARLLSISAEDGNYNAQYALAQMYEMGMGVEQNLTKAMHWYKRSATHQLSGVPLASEKSVQNNHLYQIDPKVDAEMEKHMLENIPMPKDASEREMVLSKLFGNFGLLPYEKNFLIPVAYTTENYSQRDPIAYPGYNEFDSNIETEFQVSVKKNIAYDLLGLNETLGFGYTHEVWWQFYSDSSPFRESNYRPEMWLTFPIDGEDYADTGLKAIKVAFWHESNGLGKPLSREWNQLYIEPIFYYQNLIIIPRLWYADAGPDNNDITDYLGYGHLKLNYILGRHQVNLTWRNNLKFNENNRGSIEAEWSYPIGDSKNNFWYLKAFSGYGASLMDYNHQQSRFGLGFSFSR